MHSFRANCRNFYNCSFKRGGICKCHCFSRSGVEHSSWLSWWTTRFMWMLLGWKARWSQRGVDLGRLWWQHTLWIQVSFTFNVADYTSCEDRKYWIIHKFIHIHYGLNMSSIWGYGMRCWITCGSLQLQHPLLQSKKREIDFNNVLRWLHNPHFIQYHFSIE